jgi:radical SAM protein with 4Fe4S-binding SPASM domain
MKTIGHTPKKYGIKKGAKEFPLLLGLTVTYVCNSRCTHCVFTNFPEIRRERVKINAFMPPDIFKKIAREAAKHGSVVRISGGGEPLLHPQMLELIEYAKKKGAKVGLITNGSLLTSDVRERLLKSRIDVIEISVDAADKRSYEKIRVSLKFNRVKDNIERLVKRRNELKAKTLVVVSLVNQLDMQKKLEAASRFWKRIADHVTIRKYLRFGRLPADSLSEPYLPENAPCPFPFERINIDTDGEMRFCGFDITGETDMGNVKNSSIAKAWRGEKMNRWRRYLLEGRSDLIPICKKCTDKAYRSWNYNVWHAIKKAKEKRDAILIKKGRKRC